MAIQRAARRVAGAIGHDSTIARHARPLYERALAALAGRRGIPWTINGEPFRISPYHRHRMGVSYDPEVASYLAARVRPGAVCLDVGANVGVYALQFARWSGPQGRVIAFEPNPVSAAALAEHVRMNGFERSVRIVPSAVADRPRMQTFHMSGADGMSRLGAPNPEIASRTRAVDVHVTTVDDFCAQEAVAPEWLLIDVEGFEFAVLAGARRTIAARGAALTIVVEMHPDAWAVAGWTRASAERLLMDLELTPQSLLGAVDPLASYGHVILASAGSCAAV